MKVVDIWAWVSVRALGCALGVVACSSAPPPDALSTTATTGAYTPGEVELYDARSSGEDPCRAGLASDVDFAARTADLLPGESRALDEWASCLNRPVLAHTTIVLLGGEGPDDPADVFVKRAAVVRAMLIARGIDPQRVIIGAPNATREGGAHAVKDAIRLESTYTQTLRGSAPRSKSGVR